MEPKYAGIFIQAFNTVLASFSSSQIISVDVLAPKNQFTAGDILVTIGIIGDVDGQVYMSMNAKTGQTLASEMLGGMEITQVDEMVTSAVGELCNMIMGNACSSICEGNTQVDITPPVVQVNEKGAPGGPGAAYHISILLRDLGNVDFNVAMENA